MTSRRLDGLDGLALAAADRSHGRQPSLLDPWRLSTPQIHLTKLGFKRDLQILSRTSPSSRHTVSAHASPSRALLACAMLLLPLCPGSAPKIRYLAPRKFADFVHLQHSNQELKQLLTHACFQDPAQGE